MIKPLTIKFIITFVFGLLFGLCLSLFAGIVFFKIYIYKDTPVKDYKYINSLQYDLPSPDPWDYELEMYNQIIDAKGNKVN